MRLVRDSCLGTAWKSLREIEKETGVPQASASAHLRHLTRPEWGGYLKERRRSEDGAGLFVYRLRPPDSVRSADVPMKPAARLRMIRGAVQRALEDMDAGLYLTAKRRLKEVSNL